MRVNFNRQKLSVALLTGSEFRHQFAVKKFLNEANIHLKVAFCEDASLSLAKRSRVLRKESPMLDRYIRELEKCEKVFFNDKEDKKVFEKQIPIKKGDINKPDYLKLVQNSQVHNIACYGCSILGDLWLKQYNHKIFNLHLGLSPYFRGSGTNFWAMVHNKFECVGATFMFLDAGIDTGTILHQIRARIYPGDSPQRIGNRLIQDALEIYPKIVWYFSAVAGDVLQKAEQNTKELYSSQPSRLCQRKDFNESAINKLNKNFDSAVLEYLSNKETRCHLAPIISIANHF